jgi:ABC-2 type transport system ATP-binding protein
MIVFDNASRWYGEVIGLNDITCEIGPGITALLGVNGAGKSTMMRLISGQLRPTTGTVTTFGMQPFANTEVYKVLGYCPEIDNFYEHMSGRRFVEHLARLSGIGPAEAKRRTAAAMETVGMADRCDRKIAGYSKGMRQRIKLAQAMIHEPKAILLDEPLNGLDPVGRRHYIDMLANLAARGMTILVSSHILFEVEQMTRNVIVLHRGRLLASGDLRTIRELIDRHPHRINVRTEQARALASKVASLDYVLNISFESEGLQIQTREPDRFYDAIGEIAIPGDVQITGIMSPDNNLESVFEYLVSN